VTKWEQVNSLLADAQHYGADMKANLEAARARIAELEQIATIDDERRAKLWATAKHWQARAEDAERESAELRAKLDDVPVEAIRHLVGPSPVIHGCIESAWNELAAWLKTLEVQP
jgi:hypothetical protein